ncbi:MAG TPA: hypothetical protein VNK41_06575 [Vicinamibacterales bacterium]|nr:hypothetical protein [Vicinamibacterales bacterium]
MSGQMTFARTGCACILLVAGLAAAACSAGAPPIQGPAAEVRQLAGARTRVVWVQHDGSDPRLRGTALTLMGFDSDDGQGERRILDARGSYVKPMFTADGERVIYSTRPELGPPEIFIVHWDGSGRKKVADGFAMALWTDPADEREWLYAGLDPVSMDTHTVVRFPLDDPSRRETVWTKTKISMEGFRLSPDGRSASALVPWPKAAVIELPNGRIRRLGTGCWTSLTFARGPLCWYFDGAHRNVTLVDVDSDTRWMVNINDAPGFDGAEVYHPRWTNHPRILVLSGPYNQGGRNQARTGGPQVEIYLGRFSADFSDIESWARVTRNAAGDSHPDAWIDLRRSTLPQRPSGPLGPEHVRAARSGGAGSSADAGRVLVNLQLTRPGPVPDPEAILPYRHALVVNEYKVVEVIKGEYKGKTMQVAQWAIRDGKVLPEARRTAGAGATLLVERYDAHPELEGERLIAGRESRLPLYYDVTAR